MQRPTTISRASAASTPVVAVQEVKSNSMRYHVQTLHEDRPVIACDQPGCSYSIKWKASVKQRQQQVHQKIQRFSCHACHYHCFNKVNMRKHMEVHERDGHDINECANCKHLFQDKRRHSLAATLTQERGHEQGMEDRGSLKDDLLSVHSSLHVLA